MGKKLRWADVSPSDDEDGEDDFCNVSSWGLDHIASAEPEDRMTNSTVGSFDWSSGRSLSNSPRDSITSASALGSANADNEKLPSSLNAAAKEFIYPLRLTCFVEMLTPTCEDEALVAKMRFGDVASVSSISAGSVGAAGAVATAAASSPSSISSTPMRNSTASGIRSQELHVTQHSAQASAYDASPACRSARGLPAQRRDAASRRKQTRRFGRPATGSFSSDASPRLHARRPSPLSLEGDPRATEKEQAKQEEVSEEQWARRIERRMRALELGKCTKEYRWYSEQKREDSEPLTPDPTDRSLSKRTWKKGVTNWRNAVERRYLEADARGNVDDCESVIPRLLPAGGLPLPTMTNKETCIVFKGLIF